MKDKGYAGARGCLVARRRLDQRAAPFGHRSDAEDWVDDLPNPTPPVTLPLDAPIGFYRIVGQCIGKFSCF